MQEHEAITHDPVSGMLVDMSNSYSMLNQIHVPLTLGGTVAAVPGGAMNPHFHMAVPEYGFTVLFAISALLEHWLRFPAVTPFDFSTLRYVVFGGTSVSAKDKNRYLEFFRRHGGDNEEMKDKRPYATGFRVMNELGSQFCNMQQNAGEAPETSDAPDEGDTEKESE